MKTFLKILGAVMGVVGLLAVALWLRPSLMGKISAATTNGDIYCDSVLPNWTSWSWGASINFDNPAPVQSGSRSMWVSLSPWGALYFHAHSVIDVSQYSSLTFAIKAGEQNQQLKLLVYDSNSNVVKALPLDQHGGGPATTQYTIYTIPVADLGVTQIGGVALQENTGSWHAPFFVDSVSFVGAVPVNVLPTPTPQPTQPPAQSNSNYTIYSDVLGSDWTDWSWNIWSDFQSVEAAVEGSKSIAFGTTQPWGGLYVHHTSTGVDTTNFDTLHLAMKPTKANQKVLVALYDGSNKPLTSWTKTLANTTWTGFDISLSDLNAMAKNIKGIVIQDVSGGTQNKIFVDDIRLVGSGATQPAPVITPSPVPTTTPQPSSSSGYTTFANKIYKDGQAIVLRGINWFGAETDTLVPHGLWSRGYKDMIAQIKSLGFNAVRVPICPQTLQNTPVSAIDYAQNPDLNGLTSIQVLDKIVGEMNRQGVYVLLDHHRPDCQAISELWYTGSYSESNWISDLTLMADRYKNLPYFVGIDLKNEPHGAATWGTGNTTTDWNLAAERAGKAVLATNPNILVFVEGVSSNPVCSSSYSHGWGINLEAEQCAPISTSAIPANKLVLSPHVYGPDVYMQPYFSDSSFPGNMPNIWDTQFGFLTKNSSMTLIPGEWGGKFGTNSGNPLDITFQNAMLSYLKSRGICSSFYWSLNPNSGDTGGILQDDWKSVWQNKIDVIRNFYNSCN